MDTSRAEHKISPKRIFAVTAEDPTLTSVTIDTEKSFCIEIQAINEAEGEKIYSTIQRNIDPIQGSGFKIAEEKKGEARDKKIIKLIGNFASALDLLESQRLLSSPLILVIKNDPRVADLLIKTEFKVPIGGEIIRFTESTHSNILTLLGVSQYDAERVIQRSLDVSRANKKLLAQEINTFFTRLPTESPLHTAQSKELYAQLNILSSNEGLLVKRINAELKESKRGVDEKLPNMDLESLMRYLHESGNVGYQKNLDELHELRLRLNDVKKQIIQYYSSVDASTHYLNIICNRNAELGPASLMLLTQQIGRQLNHNLYIWDKPTSSTDYLHSLGKYTPSVALETVNVLCDSKNMCCTTLEPQRGCVDHFTFAYNRLDSYFNDIEHFSSFIAEYVKKEPEQITEKELAQVLESSKMQVPYLLGEKLESGNQYVIRVLPLNRIFIGFVNIGVEEKQTERSDVGKIAADYGLKFHISLPEWDKEMFKEGWDIIKDTLMKHSVGSFKVIRPFFSMYSDSPGQFGKQVTIYADHNPGMALLQWQAIFEEITRKLVVANITPGYRSLGAAAKEEAAISGCNYVTYRYHNELTGKSIWPTLDPCVKIAVNVPSQCPIPVCGDDPRLGPNSAGSDERKLSGSLAIRKRY